MIETTKLANLQKKLKTDQKQRKPLQSRSAQAKSPKGNDVLDKLQNQLAEQTRKKEALKAAAAEKISETKTAGASARPVRSAPVVKNSLLAAKADFPTIIKTSKDLSTDLEHGQAETPISNFFQAIPDTDAQRWPNTSILPTSAEARSMALAWLSQTPEKLFSTPTDLLEINFQNEGFSLRSNHTGELTTATDIVEFAKLVKGKGSEKIRSQHMALPASKGFKHTKIICAKEAESIANNPAIISRMASQTSLLIVAARTNEELNLAVIKELAEPIETILPVLFSNDENSKLELKEIDNCRILPTIVIAPGNLRPKVQDALTNELKKQLAHHDVSKQIQSGIDLIAERQTKREKEIRKRKKDARHLQTQIDEEMKETQNASRSLLGDLRQKLDEQVSGIFDWTKTRNKRQFSPTGEYTEFAEEISGQLTESHLEKVESVSSRRYGLPGCVVDVIEDEVVERLYSNVKGSVAEVQTRLRTYIANVEEELTEFHQQPVSIDVPEINEKEIWSEIRQYCQIDPKIGIDLPKRDALRMFMSGSRQFIMPITMILGGPLAKVLLPMFGADRNALTSNPIFTGSLVGLMVVGLILFFRSARAMDREKMEQSVEKMRETVRSRIIREMERVEREKQELIQTTVNRLKDEWQGNLKNWVDEAITVSQTRLGRESAKVKSAGVVLQKRVREVDQTRKQVEKLSSQFELIQM